MKSIILYQGIPWYSFSFCTILIEGYLDYIFGHSSYYLPHSSVCPLVPMGKAKKKAQPPRIASMSALRGQFTRTKTQLAKEKELSAKLQTKQKDLEKANQEQMEKINELKALLEKSNSKDSVHSPEKTPEATPENSDIEQERESDTESLAGSESVDMDLRGHIDHLKRNGTPRQDFDANSMIETFSNELGDTELLDYAEDDLDSDLPASGGGGTPLTRRKVSYLMKSLLPGSLDPPQLLNLKLWIPQKMERMTNLKMSQNLSLMQRSLLLIHPLKLRLLKMAEKSLKFLKKKRRNWPSLQRKKGSGQKLKSGSEIT